MTGSSFEVGSLYFALGITDLTDKQLAEALKRAEKWVAQRDLTLTLTVDDAKVKPGADKAAGTVDAARKSIEAPMRLDAVDGGVASTAKAASGAVDTARSAAVKPWGITADASGVKAPTSEAASWADAARADAEKRFELSADASGVKGPVSSAESLFDRLRGRGETPIVPHVDVDAIAADGERGQQNLVDMIGGWKTAAMAAAGVVGGAIGSKLFDAMDEYLSREKLSDLMAARLDLDPKVADKFSKAAAAVFASGWGESIDQVHEAVESAFANGLIDEKSTSADVEKVTTKLLILTSVFGQDIPLAAKAAGNAVKTHLVKDSSEAFDLLVKGYQRGAGASDDFLDSIKEYSVEFQKAGVSGDMAVGLILQGLKAGARDTDTIANGIKEFGLRSKDASATSAQGYEILGLSAEKYTRMAAEGGDGAAQALSDVITKINAMTDPVTKNTALIDLFGTSAEDLQLALTSMNPATAVATLGQIGGAADIVGQKVGDNLASKWEGWQRTAQLGLQNYLGGLVEAYKEGGFNGVADKLGEDIDGLAKAWDEHGDEIIDATTKWWNEHGEPAAETAMTAAFDLAWSMTQSYLKDRVGDPSWWEHLVVDSMMGPFAGSMKAHEAEWGLTAVAWLDSIPGAVAKEATGMWDGIGTEFANMLNGMIDMWNRLRFPAFTMPTVHTPFGDVGGGQIGGWDLPDVGPVTFHGHGSGNNAWGNLGNQLPVPHFHSGGYVDAPPGKEVAAIVRGGETIRNQAQEAAVQMALTGTGWGRVGKLGKGDEGWGGHPIQMIPNKKPGKGQEHWGGHTPAKPSTPIATIPDMAQAASQVASSSGVCCCDDSSNADDDQRTKQLMVAVADAIHKATPRVGPLVNVETVNEEVGLEAIFRQAAHLEAKASP